MSELSRPVVEAASWQLAAMIIRRHPNLEVMRHHPGGGLYDVLGIIEGTEQVIALNRSGSIQGATRPDATGRSFTWADYICATDRSEFVADLEGGVSPA